MKRYGKDVAVICFFIFIVCAFFYQTIIFGKLPVPTDTLIGLYHPWRDLYAETNPRGVPYKNFLITDPIRQQIPWRKMSIDSWKRGEIPWWNPSSFSGTPLLANIQAAALYPLNFIFFLFDFPYAWTILIVVQPLLAAICMYAFLHRINLSRWASVFGALSWSFSGFFIAWLTWGTIDHVALWLPLVLLSVHHIIEDLQEKQQRRTSLVCGVVFIFAVSLQFFAGHSQIFLYSMGAAFVYGTRLFIDEGKDAQRKNFGVLKFPLLAIAVGVFVVICITSVQWLPMLGLIEESGRMKEITNWQIEGWFLPWEHLLQFFAPDFFGNPATLNYWGKWNYGEFVGYIGVVPVFFAFLAITQWNNRHTRFWSLSFFTILLFILPNPISEIPYRLSVPVLSVLQPTRLMVLVDFILAVLASIGIDHWIKRHNFPTKEIVGMGSIYAGMWIFTKGYRGVMVTLDQLDIAARNLVIPTGIFILLIFFLFIASLRYKKGHVKNGVHLMMVIGIMMTLFDLFRFGWKFTPFTPPSYFFPPTQAITFLQNQPKPFRVMSLDERLLPANVSAYYGIDMIGGYDPIFSGRYEAFIAASERGKPDINPPFGFHRIVTPKNVDSPLLPLLHVRYVVSLEDISRPFLTKVFQEGETRVYEYKQSLPFAYFANPVPFEGVQHTMDSLFDQSFLSQKNVVTEPSILGNGTTSKGNITLVVRRPTYLEFETENISEAFLFLSVPWSASWRVSVDGKSSILYKANYVFQGAMIPEGNHRVVFSDGWY